jgi:hypothetical protein
MFRSFRYRWAFASGRKEHFFSRLLFLCLLITFGLHYFKYYYYEGIMLIVDIVLWLLYYLFHRLEKAFFPGHIR